MRWSSNNVKIYIFGILFRIFGDLRKGMVAMLRF